MTDREAPPNWGFDCSQDDPYEGDGWFGREQVAEYVSVNEVVPDQPPVHPTNNVREEPRVAPREVDPAPPPPTRRPASPTVNTWTVNGQLRASNNSALTFRAPPPPWYRTKQARIALIAAVSAAVAVPVAVLVWPSSPASSPGVSTSVSPQASTSAQPAPTSARPTPINAPPPPLPPPPPPPPPTEDTDSAPAYTQPDPWTPPQTEKPDVTPTPVTRAPISVAPVPRRPAETDLTKDSDKPGCGGWC